MLFLFEWLNDHLNYDISPTAAAELLTRHAFAVESVKKTSAGTLLEIEILPNRAPDCFSHAGVAREINALCAFKGGFKLRPGRRKVSKTTRRPSKLPWLKVGIEDVNDCAVYKARYFTRVKVGPSPPWLTTRLGALGFESINNVVDATNYVMLDTGQPLHAFDAAQLRAGATELTINIRRARLGEQVKALDGVTYSTPAGVLLVTSKDNILALAGIKGALAGSITDTTKEVLVEAANFSGPLTYRSAAALKIRTDASMRFSVGLSSGFVDIGLAAITKVLEGVAGANLGGEASSDLKPARLASIALLNDHISERAGITIKKMTSRHALMALGFKVGAPKNRQSWRVSVPMWRKDINGEHDLIEEVLRLYGYESIPANLPNFKPASLESAGEWNWQQLFKEAWRGVGFDEVQTYSLVAQADLELVGIDLAARARLKLRNALSADKTHLRASLVPGLIRAVDLNLRHASNVQIYETGRVFRPQAQGLVEQRMAAGIVYKAPVTSGLAPAGEEFYALKGMIETALEHLGVSEFTYTPLSQPQQIWHPGRSAQISVGGQVIGILGELAPQVRQVNKFKNRAVAFEIDLDVLRARVVSALGYIEPPKYPAVLRDISLIVGHNVTIASILEIINAKGHELVENVELFDWYEDPASFGDHKKSLAFHIRFRSRERTLSDPEVDSLMEAIVKSLEAQFSAIIR